jgi:hypothetical protein
VKQLRCAYLTMDDMGDYVSDASLSFDAMARHGWSVDMVAWQDRSVSWIDYDAVYICTPWDYPQHADEFVSVLERIDRSTALLVNDLSLVRWTLAKTYLRDLEERGVDIVPSAWYDDIDVQKIAGFFAAHDTNKVVIKPSIGANAMDTYVLTDPVGEVLVDKLLQIYANRSYFVQPFIENIQHEGEYSLFFFAGDYSHAILKSPEDGDFRVQEEHGADIVSVVPEAALIKVARQVIEKVAPQPVYVRADFVRGSDGRFLVMELELIEPSLYFRTDADAADRFASAFTKHFHDQHPGS